MPKTRDRRILRGKLQRFRRRKFEKSTPQTRNIGARQASARFEKQRTIHERANAIARRAQRRMRAIFKTFAKNCRVFDAENLKNQRRRRKISLSKIFLRILKRNTQPNEDARNLQMQFVGMHDAENTRSASFARKIAAFSTPKI